MHDGFMALRAHSAEFLPPAWIQGPTATPPRSERCRNLGLTDGLQGFYMKYISQNLLLFSSWSCWTSFHDACQG